MNREKKHSEISRLLYDLVKSDDKKIKEELIQNIYHVIKQNKPLESLLSKDDIDDYLEQFEKYYNKFNTTYSQVNEYVKSTLLLTQEYHFYFTIYDTPRMSTIRVNGDYSVGYCKYIKFIQLPEPIQKNLKSEWMKHFDKENHILKSKDKFDEYIEQKKNSIFLFLSIFANGNNKAKELAIGQCEDSLDLIRIENKGDCTIGRYDVFIKDSGEYIFNGFPIHYDIPICQAKDFGYDDIESVLDDFSGEIHDWFESMSYIVNEGWYEYKQAREWGRKLKNAIHLYALAICQKNSHIKLILLFSALETLLLFDSDKDSIASKLAERVALLHYSKTEERIIVYEKIKKLYNMRSRYIHQGDKEQSEVNDSCEYLESVVMNTIGDLEGFLYPRGDPDTGHEIYLSFKDYIDKIKFSGKLDNENF